MTEPLSPRYILCQYVPMDNGKSNKIPLNPYTLKAHDPLKPEIHMSYSDAKQKADALGDSYGIGFVIMHGDGYFFIDLDNCLLADGNWNETAINTLGYFPGAYVEVSHSGRGLHIIGRFEGDAPFTGRRFDKLGIEMYTEGRFCALAQINPMGDAQSLHTERLSQFSEALGANTPTGATTPAEWTTESDPKYNVPEDNAQLINWFLNKPLSKDEAFGNVLSIRHLWENNVEVLAKHFHTTIPGKPYDFSAADAALAYRLHYLVGGNCERVQELMWLSNLKRDKWEASPNYLPRTILNARGVKLDYFVHARPPQAITHDNKASDPAQQQIGAFLSIEQQVAYFQSCTYVADLHAMLTPEGIVYKPDTFNAMYGGVSFQLDFNNQKVTRKAFEAFTQSQGHTFPKVHSTCFKPLLQFGEIITEYGIRSVNTYRDLNILRTKESVELFLLHLEKLLPNPEDRLILLSYMAALVQYKGVKFTWCIIIQGAPGNGKTILNDILAYCMGRQYTHSASSVELVGKFNGWMDGKLLITVDDIYQTRWDMIEILKPMITNRFLEIERKGVDKIMKEICCNFFLCTNNKDGVPKTRDDRRFAPLFCAQQSQEDVERDGMGYSYFNRLRDWVFDQKGNAAIYEFLSTFEIPDKYNPTKECIRAPITSSTEEAISFGHSSNESLILNWIEEGCMGFKNGWVSSILLNRKMLEVNNKISPKYLPSILEKLGYIPHPCLNKGRASKIVKLDGGQSKLYITKNHPSKSITDASAIVDSYEKDQSH